MRRIIKKKIIKRTNIKIFLIIGGMAVLLYVSGQLGNGDFFNSHLAFGYGGGIVGGGGGGIAPPSTINAYNIPLTISASQGGNLVSNFTDGSKAELQVPQAAAGKQATFEASSEGLAVTNKPDEGLGASVVSGKVFNLTAKDSANNPVKDFSSKLTITLTLSTFPSDAANLGVYYLDTVLNRWVKVSGATFDQVNKKVTFKVSHLTTFAVIEVAGVPETLAIGEAAALAYADGSLLKTASDPKVYLIDNSQKRWIPTGEIFTANSYSWSNVEVVDPGVLAQYTEGPNVQQAAVSAPTIPEGGLIRAIGDLDVYIVKYVGSKKFKRLILSPSVFNSYEHLKWSDIKDVDGAVVDSFTTSDLVRAAGDPKVYKLYPSGDTGEKRWIKTAAAFSNLGFDWDAIYEINRVDRDSYRDGASLE